MNKKVFFVVANRWTGSAIVRGIQVSEELSKNDFSTACVSHDELSDIKNSIIVFIKHHDSNQIDMLKKNNNILVLDVVDGYGLQGAGPTGTENSPLVNVKHNTFIREYFDGYILPTKRLWEDIKEDIPSNSHTDVIYQHADPKAEKYRKIFQKKTDIKYDFRLGYLGGIENGLYNEHSAVKEHLTSVYKFEDQIRWAPYFTCHYSIRKERTADFLYKPPSKVATAAAVDANIIHTKDSCMVEIIGDEYPYYTNSDFDSVLKTINFAKETFNSEVWAAGLDMMKEVKSRLSIERVLQDYIKYFDTLEN